MLRRLIKWVFLLTVLLILFIGFGLPAMANTETGRKNVAEALGDALDRNVALGGLNIGWFFSSFKIEELRIDNPKGFPEGHFLKAGSVEFDSSFKELLDRRVKGGLVGKGLDVHIIRKDGKTNLDGLAKGGDDEEEKDDGGKGPDVDLSLELADSRLTIEDLDKNEKLVLEGVGLAMQFSNHKGAQDAGLTIRIKSIDRDTISIRDLEIDAKAVGDLLELENLSAKLPGKGKLTGTGQMRVRNGDDWKVKLDAVEVGINEDMMPIVSALFPFASKAEGQVNGQLDAGFDVSGRGLTWEAMKQALAGTGKVKLTGLSLPADSLLGQAAQFAGRSSGALDLKDAGAQFAVADGWINFNRLSAAGDEVRYDLAGRVSLDGALDLNMDLMPLIDAFGGGDRYGKIRQHLKKVPVRIAGTTAAPQLKAPKAEDLVKENIGGIVEKEVGGLLDKIGKKK